jgi:hypothetical protein
LELQALENGGRSNFENVAHSLDTNIVRGGLSGKKATKCKKEEKMTTQIVVKELERIRMNGARKVKALRQSNLCSTMRAIALFRGFDRSA